MNTQLQKENIVELPEGFTARGARIEDVEPALVLFNRWSRSVIGRDEITDAQPSAMNGSHRTSTCGGYSSGLRTERTDGWLHRSVDHCQTPRPPVDMGTRRSRL